MMTIPRRLKTLAWLAALFIMGAVMPVAQETENSPCFSVKESPLGPGNWRRNWEIRLRTIPTDPIIPDTIIVTIINRCKTDTLRAYGPYISMHSVDANAIDSLLPDTNIILAPGDSLVYRHAFRTFTMVGYSGKPLDTAILFERMRTTPWSIRADICDMDSPKPWTESSWLAYSNLVYCNSQATR